jgi:transposase
LRCLRGIDTLSAVGLCAEVGGDFHRFERPKLLMSYLGLTPSEDTSGEKRRQGAITKSGSQHPGGCWSRPRGTTAGCRGSG